MQNMHWLEVIDTLTEQVVAMDRLKPDAVYVTDAKLTCWSLAWFEVTCALAQLVGCAVVFDISTGKVTAVGNRANVDALVAAHRDCYKTLKRNMLQQAAAIARQAGNVLRTERRPYREERIALEETAWHVVGIFPELRDLAHPHKPVLLTHGGQLRLGGILPQQG